MKNSCDDETLKFLTNPIYKTDVNVIPQLNKTITNADKKFYRKRIIAMTKDLFKTTSNNITVDKSFSNYIEVLINYFKMIDKKDILQKEYNQLDNDISSNKFDFDVDTLLKEANENIMIEQTVGGTLDNFVVSNQNEINAEEVLPTIKQINLKDEKLKTKGVKIKGKKK